MKSTVELLQAVAEICKDNDEKRAKLTEAKNGGLEGLKSLTLATMFIQARSCARLIEDQIDGIWLLLALNDGVHSVMQAARDSLIEAHQLQLEFCQVVQEEIERRVV